MKAQSKIQTEWSHGKLFMVDMLRFIACEM